MNVALDTNVLVYFEGINDRERRDAAQELVRRLAPHRLVLPAQVLGELYSVLTGKGRMQAVAARPIVERWRMLAHIAPTAAATVAAALELVTAHRLQFWDAVILAAAAEAECQLLLSEDMHDGFVWRGVTVANPFAATPHPLLVAL